MGSRTLTRARRLHPRCAPLLATRAHKGLLEPGPGCLENGCSPAALVNAGHVPPHALGPTPHSCPRPRCAPPQAIKAREEVLERLRTATYKVDAALGGCAPIALSTTDPLVRLFFRWARLPCLALVWE